MANIATVAVRILAARPLSISDAEIVRLLLVGDDTSYCVPLYVHHGDDAVDVQYGFRWSPDGGPDDLFAAIGHEVEHLFVRWHDSGFGLDQIYEVRAGEPSAPRLCRYGFDELRVRDDAGERVIAVAGSYRAGNSRVPAIAAPGTPTTLAGHTGAPVEAIDPSAAASLVASLAEAKLVEWRWRGRTVRSGRRFADGHWSYFCMDDWDNCIDGDYRRARGEPLVVPTSVAAADRDDLRHSGVS